MLCSDLVCMAAGIADICRQHRVYTDKFWLDHTCQDILLKGGVTSLTLYFCMTSVDLSPPDPVGTT